MKAKLDEAGVRVTGPELPRLSPRGMQKIGIQPGHIHKPGKVVSFPFRYADL